MTEIIRWLEMLEQQGYRITGPRRAIVELLVNSDHALNPMDVYDKARSKYPRMGLVTVYRTLEKLEELHLIQRVHQPCGCNAYLPQARGHQHLIICDQCGKAQFFEGDDLNGFFNHVGADLGYAVKDHWLQLFGTCSDCSK